ncbi:MAG: CARDB domain-containing protein, partial [candidate division WOR-3 bacterium]
MSKIKTIIYITILLIGIQMAFGATLLYEDFEGTTFPPTNWETQATGTCGAWVQRSGTQAHIFDNASAGVVIASNNERTGTTYLKSSSINLSSPTVETLCFYFRCPGSGAAYGFASSLDTMKVEISIDGTNWSPILVMDSGYIYSRLPTQASIYKEAIDLGSYNEQTTVYIRWIFYDYYQSTVGTNRYFLIDSVWVYDQELFQPNQPPTISNVTRIPTNPEPLQSVIVRAKIYDDYCPVANIRDSLFYAVNDSSTWFRVWHDSLHSADSTFYYTIPGQTNGSKVYYYVWAQDDSNASVRTPTYSYNVIAPPTARILMRPRYVQGGATPGTPGTGTPFAFYVGVKPGANNDSFYYKGRIGGRGLTWNISGNNWAADNAAWASLSKILCGSVNDTTKLWVFMKAQPTATVDTALSLRVRHIDAGLNYDSDTLPIKILDMTTAGDGGWLYGHIYEYNGGPARENVVVMAYQGEEIVGAYATENNEIDEGYNSSNAGYIRMAVKSGTIDSLQVRNRTTNEILSFYTEISGPWIVFAGDSTSLDIQQAPIITNVTRNPKIPLLGEPVAVTAKIYDNLTPLSNIIDTLFYALNTTTTWNYVLKNSYNPLDSTFNYTIPATASEGDTVFYKISATDEDNNTTVSATYRYTIPFERTIDQIQGTTSASPETLKYVHTKGIVTGTFGSRFFFAQRPGGARNELYVYRRYQDSLPKLNIGDSVSVIGIVKEYNTLTEIDAGYNLNGDVRIHATGKPLPCTTLLAIAGVSEDYEGCLIRIDSLHFKATGTFAGGTNYWACNNNETESLRVRIDAACLDIIGQPIPTETIAIIGNLSVYKDTFQLMPRFLGDLHSLQQILDVGVVSVDAPSGTLYQGFSYPVKATVKNYGNVPAPQFDVIFTITATKGGEYCDTVTVPGLAVGQQSSITFDNYLASDLGLFSTMAKTVLSGDVNVANDSNFGSGIEVVTAPTAFWTQKEPVTMNLVPAVEKVIKDGGALVGVGDDYLYAFIGTKTNVFRKYTIGSKSGWETVESLPFGFKYKPETGVDTTARNKKFVGKGAALCYDGVSKIYATRGNGTWDFWVYDINNPGWTLLKHVPTP